MRSQKLGLTIAATLLGLLALIALHTGRTRAALQQPLSFAGSSYAGSDTCRTCHPQQFSSWHRTFHRTMTQAAGPSSVLGAFDGRRFEYGGIEAVLRRDASGAPVMAWSRDGGRERWSAVVERTVGSRRFQQYLARSDDLYYRLPIAWSIEEQRFIHMNGAFLTPDPEPLQREARIERADYDRHVTRWNDNCIFCHNVAPRPGLQPETGHFRSEVAELGIACEACHGPGAQHAAHNRDPVRRFALHLSTGRDPTIANPARLPPQRSAEICGRCHGQRMSPDIEHVHRFGDGFLPGEQLASYSKPLWRDTLQDGEPGAFATRFWPDGTPRLTAYEYQGLLQSPCAQRGELQCTSCHGMHEGDPRGQLRPALVGDGQCTTCHDAFASDAAKATHAGHPASSTGARCVACHMPPIVYGIVGAHVSHRIDAPQLALPAGASRPDPCTLCHLDKSRAWAARARSGQPGADDDAPEAVRLLLSGDPIERAIAAAAFGGSEATAAGAAPGPRLGLLADVMQHDEYPAVRAIAFRAFRALCSARYPGAAPEAAAFTATDSPAARARAVARIIERLPVGALVTPAEGTRALRALASDVRISIGE